MLRIPKKKGYARQRALRRKPEDRYKDLYPGNYRKGATLSRGRCLGLWWGAFPVCCSKKRRVQMIWNAAWAAMGCILRMVRFAEEVVM